MPNVHELLPFDLLSYLADASFRDTALLHDALLNAACEHGPVSPTSHVQLDLFNKFSRMAHVTRASMTLQWPEATAAWLGE
jgi:hypothetical protein